MNPPLLYSIPSVLVVLFGIAMIVHCIRQQNPIFWVFIVLSIPFWGAGIYFILHVLPDLGLGMWWNRTVSGGRRIRELKHQIHHQDLPYHWARLGDEYRARRDWSEAERCYEEALKRDPKSDETHYGLAQTELELGQYDDALARLAPFIAEDPRYDYGNAMLGRARALHALGRREEALDAFQRLLKSYTYSHARYEYGELLHELGRTDEAERQMRQILEDARAATGFSRAQERRWARLARLWLLRH